MQMKQQIKAKFFFSHKAGYELSVTLGGDLNSAFANRRVLRSLEYCALITKLLDPRKLHQQLLLTPKLTAASNYQQC